MKMTDIYDSNHALIAACDDLKAIQSIILTVGEHDEYANAYETLTVIDHALNSIVSDIQEAVDTIDKALISFEQEKENTPD